MYSGIEVFLFLSTNNLIRRTYNLNAAGGIITIITAKITLLKKALNEGIKLTIYSEFKFTLIIA